MAHYLVTGGAGFIGSNIVHRLVADEAQVTVLDNFSTGKMRNLEGVLERIRLLSGDLKDLDTVREAVAGAEYVLHQAALPSVQRSVDDPRETNQSNVVGTLNLLVAARDAGVKALVYAASSSAYGDTPTLPKQEEMPPQPLSPYAVSKLVGEYYCMVFAQLYGLPTVSLRYFNVFGPRQDPEGAYAAVIPKWIAAMIAGNEVRINGDGGISRDFCYVKNVVQANLLAATVETPEALNRAYNVANGHRIA